MTRFARLILPADGRRDRLRLRALPTYPTASTVALAARVLTMITFRTISVIARPRRQRAGLAAHQSVVARHLIHP